MTKLLTLALTTALVACGPRIAPPLCDREAQEWTKYGTQEDQCITPEEREAGLPHKRKPPVVIVPDDPSYPGDDDLTPPRKGNNGWGNGDQDAPGNSEGHNGAENKGGNHNGEDDAPGGSWHE